MHVSSVNVSGPIDRQLISAPSSTSELQLVTMLNVFYAGIIIRRSFTTLLVLLVVR